MYLVAGSNAPNNGDRRGGGRIAGTMLRRNENSELAMSTVGEGFQIEFSAVDGCVTSEVSDVIGERRRR